MANIVKGIANAVREDARELGDMIKGGTERATEKVCMSMCRPTRFTNIY